MNELSASNVSSSNSFTDILNSLQTDATDNQFQSGTLNGMAANQSMAGAQNFQDNGLALVQPQISQPSGTTVPPASERDILSWTSTTEDHAPPSRSQLGDIRATTSSNDRHTQLSKISVKAGGKSNEPQSGHKNPNIDKRMIGTQSTENPRATAGTASPAIAAKPDVATANISRGDEVPSNDAHGEAVPATKGRNSTVGNSSSDLAFAVKIQGANPTAAPAPTQSNSGDLGDCAVNDAVMSSSPFASQLSGMMALTVPKIIGQSKPANGDASASTGGVPGTSSGGYQSTQESADEIPEAEEAAPITSVPDEPQVTGQAVKTVQIQITGADERRVDLRLVEKAGALAISVRSANGTLTKSLQQNLPELSSRLSDQQIRAEWWRADAEIPASPLKAENSQDGKSNSENQNPGDQNPGNRNNGNSEQQGGRDTRQPDWLEEISSPRISNQNGTQFSWQL